MLNKLMSLLLLLMVVAVLGDAVYVCLRPPVRLGFGLTVLHQWLFAPIAAATVAAMLLN